MYLPRYLHFLFWSHSVVLQPRCCRNSTGLGSCAFARHYLRNHCYFLFLRVLRCFSSPGLLTFVYYVFNIVGCPIRIPADHLVCAHPRSFSQLVASFIASESLGIPRAPFSAFPAMVVETTTARSFFLLVDQNALLHLNLNFFLLNQISK